MTCRVVLHATATYELTLSLIAFDHSRMPSPATCWRRVFPLIVFSGTCVRRAHSVAAENLSPVLLAASNRMASIEDGSSNAGRMAGRAPAASAAASDLPGQGRPQQAPVSYKPASTAPGCPKTRACTCAAHIAASVLTCLARAPPAYHSAACSACMQMLASHACKSVHMCATDVCCPRTRLSPKRAIALSCVV